MNVARTAVVMVLSILLPLCVQLWDKRRLDQAQRARAWNYASWGTALYAFGPISMLGWSWVTRPRWRRVLFGPLWMGALLVMLSLVDALIQALAGMPIEEGPVDFAIGGGAAIAAGIALLALMEGVVSALAWRRARRVGMGAAWSDHPPSPPRPASP